MAEIKKISTELQLLDKFLDTSGDAGTSGQVLTSTGTGINWVSGGSLPGGPYLPLSAGSSYPLTGDLYLKTTNDASVAREKIIWQTSQGTNRSFIRVGGSYANNALEFGTGNSILGMILHANAGLSIGTTVATTLPPASGLLVQGKVGIGTTSPDEKLHVSEGKLLVDITNSVGSELTLKNNAVNQFSADKNYHEINFITSNTSSDTAGGYIRIKAGQEASGNNNSSYLSFWTAPNAGAVSEKLRIDSSGNVGIGTTSPNQDGFGSSATVLSIKAKTSGGSANTELIGLGNNNNDQVGMVGFMSQSATSPLATIRALRHTSDTSGKLTFDTAGDERMRIDYDGNVGIGTDSPSARLHVKGSADGSYIMRAMSSAATDLGGFFQSTSGDGEIYLKTSAVATNVRISSNNVSYFNGGNVGIGTTSPDYKLQVNGTIAPEGNEVNNLGSSSNRFNQLWTKLIYDINDGRGLNNQVLTSTGSGGISWADASTVIGGPYLPLSAGSSYPLTNNLFINNGFTLSWGADTTKIAGNSSTNELSLKTASTTRVHINSSGNVGIGTTNPRNDTNFKTLQIGDSSTAASQLVLDDNDSNGPWRIISNQSLIINDDNQERMRIDYDGKVGIGTSDPVNDLNVNGDIGYIGVIGQGSIYGNTGNNSYANMQLYNPATGFSTFNNQSYGYYFLTGGGTKMTILNNGNVGIGMTSPPSKLTVMESTLLTNSGTDAGASYVPSKPILLVTTDGDGTASSSYATNSVFTVGIGGGVTGGVTTEHFRVNLNGNVGIGTDSPDVKLHIVGDGDRLEISSADYDLIKMGAYGDSGADLDNGFLNLSLDGSEKIRLLANGNSYFNGGNVGIGTTSPNSKLDIRRSGNGIALELHQTSGSANDFVDLKMIAGNTTAGTLGTILRHKRDGSGGGDFSILTNPSLTGTPTEKLIIKSGGNVGIGTTTPNVSGAGSESVVLSVIETAGNRRGILELGDNQNADTGGIGSINFVGHYQDAGHKIMAEIRASGSGATSGQRGSFIGMFTKENSTAAIAERMRIDSAGSIKFNAYNGTNNTGSPTHILGTDANGLIVKSTAGSSIGPWLPLAAGSGDPLTGDLYINKSAPALRLNDSGSNKPYELRVDAETFSIKEVSNSRTLMSITTGAVITLDSLASNTVINTTGAMVVPNGNVGIGNDDPGAKLGVKGNYGDVIKAVSGSQSITTNFVAPSTGSGINNIISTAGKFNIGTSDAQPFSLLTSSISRIAILSGGNVGIGITNPSYKLEVSGTLGVNRTDGIIFAGSGGSGMGNKITADTSNDLIFSTSLPSAPYTVSEKMRIANNGATTFTSTVTATNFILSSDERLKENVKKVCDNRVKADWKTFELKTDKGQKRYGVIAQELEKTNPEFVREDNQGFKSVAYIDLLIAKIAELEARLEKLEK